MRYSGYVPDGEPEEVQERTVSSAPGPSQPPHERQLITLIDQPWEEYRFCLGFSLEQRPEEMELELILHSS